MKLVNFLMGVCFVCILVGLAGLAGTIEQAETNMQGIALSVFIILLGFVSGLIAAKEDGYFRNKK